MQVVVVGDKRDGIGEWPEKAAAIPPLISSPDSFSLESISHVPLGGGERGVGRAGGGHSGACRSTSTLLKGELF